MAPIDLELSIRVSKGSLLENALPKRNWEPNQSVSKLKMLVQTHSNNIAPLTHPATPITVFCITHTMYPMIMLSPISIMMLFITPQCYNIH